MERPPSLEDDPGLVWPRSRTTLGLSLIAIGHSGADAFTAGCIHDYVRLYRITKDVHFLRSARFLQRGTAQAMDWDGALGHAIPWLGVAVLEPLARLRDE